MNSIYRLLMVALLGGVSAAYQIDTDTKSLNTKTVHPTMYVWTAEKPNGQYWANLGENGAIGQTTNPGMNGKGNALTIVMTGKSFRNCGLNWKGWYPEDACSDVSKFRCLTFYIRQQTRISNVDLRVELVDNIKRSGLVTPGNTISILASGGIEKIDQNWQKVTIDLNHFARGKSLDLTRLWGINFSNQGSNRLVFEIDRIGFSLEEPPMPHFPKTSPYDATGSFEDRMSHTISNGIYGVCDLPLDQLRELNIPITRWGGNTSSRYNWKKNADNGAADWYFKNRPNHIYSGTESAYRRMIQDNEGIGAGSYITIPMLGWVAKDFESYSFPVTRFGKQKATEPKNPDIGNGVREDGTLISTDPHLTSIPIDPEFVSAGISHAIGNCKSNCPSDISQQRMWVLDNEPMLWHSTHRDVHPQPLSYDELWKRTLNYARAIRQQDPNAKIAGLCSWGWNDLFYSALDRGEDEYGSRPDWLKHQKIDLAKWYILQCGLYRQREGKPLVDILDLHWYPQSEYLGKNPYTGKGMEPEFNRLRLRSIRDLWDRNYVSESWISKTTMGKNGAYVLPRVREWIEQGNPGMKLCLGEYNFGGSDNISGTLAQCELFGILAQEKVDLAFIWSHPEGSQFAAWKLFRNYDGKMHTFGDQFLPAKSNQENLSIFAARRSSDQAVTVVLINKNLGGSCHLNLKLPGKFKKMSMYVVDQDTNNQVKECNQLPKFEQDNCSFDLSAASVSLLVLE